MKRFKLFSTLFLIGLLAYVIIGLYTNNPNPKTTIWLQKQGYLPFPAALVTEGGYEHDITPMGKNQDSVFAGDAVCLIAGESNSQYSYVYIKPEPDQRSAAQNAWMKVGLGYSAISILTLVLFVVLAVLTLKVIAGFIREQVFDRTQSVRLTWSAICLMLCEACRIGSAAVLYLLAKQHLHLEGWKVVFPEVNIGGIVVALLLLLLNELLRKATQFKKENDLTI